jgi:hypothetical protein
VVDGQDRAEFLEHVETWRRQRDVRPENETKNFPWPNASNMATPATAIVTNGIYTQLIARFVGQDSFFVVETDDPEKVELDKALTRMLKIISHGKSKADLRSKNSDIFQDTVSIGTQFVVVPWKIRRMQFNRMSEGGGKELVDRTVYEGPDVDVPRIEQVITRPYWKDPDTAPWITISMPMYGYQLRQGEANGFFENVSAIEGYALTEPEENMRAQAERVGIQIDYENALQMAQPYEIYLSYVFWDADGDGVAEDLAVWWEPTSGEIIRAEYNELGSRPIVRIPYIDRPGLLYARGVGWYAELLQDEIDSYHNIRNNSLAVSSLQMFVSRRGQFKNRRHIFHPLENVEVDNPREDFMPITFPDVSGSTLNAEMLTRQYLQQVVAAGDALLGQGDSQAKTRATASGSAQQLQVNRQIVNSIQESVAEAYGQIGMKMLLQIVANKERSIEWIVPMLPRQDQQLVTAFLQSVNVEDIPRLVTIRVQIADQADSEAARRQGLMMISAMYNQYTQQGIQLAMMAANDQLPQEAKEFATRGIVGMTRIMEKSLEAFKEKGKGTYLPDVEGYDLMLDMLDQQRQQQYAQVRQQLQQSEYAQMFGGGGVNGPEASQPGAAGLGPVPTGAEGTGVGAGDTGGTAGGTGPAGPDTGSGTGV